MARERLTIDISSGAIFRIVLILVGFWFVYVIFDVLIMLFAAMVVAAAIEPLANYLQQYRVPRSLSVAGVYGLILLAFIGLVMLLVEPLTNQLTQFTHALPQLVGSVSHWLPFPAADEATLTTTIQEVLLRVANSIGNIGVNIVQRTGTFFSGLFAILFVFIIAFYLVVEQDALKKFARLITPREHLPYIELAIERMHKHLGRWVLAQLALALIVGLVVGCGLWLFGVDYALVLGILAGVLEVIPVIGPIIAAVPGVIVGFSESLTLGVVALVWYIIVQQLENNVLVPTIMRRAVGLNPLVTMIAILLGARLAGVPGIILAVPVATILGIFVADVFSSLESDDELP